MKKMALYCFLVLMMTGCSKTELQEPQYKPESLVGYMAIEDDTLYVDGVEIFNIEDESRIKELGLNAENDLPNGYYIYNPTVEVVSFELTDDTVYTFTDYGLVFVKEVDGNRTYETNKKQEFLEASSYQDLSLEKQKIPYFVDVYAGKVISITEEFIYTQ